MLRSQGQETMMKSWQGLSNVNRLECLIGIKQTHSLRLLPETGICGGLNPKGKIFYYIKAKNTVNPLLVKKNDILNKTGGYNFAGHFIKKRAMHTLSRKTNSEILKEIKSYLQQISLESDHYDYELKRQKIIYLTKRLTFPSTDELSALIVTQSFLDNLNAFHPSEGRMADKIFLLGYVNSMRKYLEHL